MRYRQVSVRRLAEQLSIIHETMENQLSMKKVCTRWIKKLLTPIERCHNIRSSGTNIRIPDNSENFE